MRERDEGEEKTRGGFFFDLHIYIYLSFPLHTHHYITHISNWFPPCQLFTSLLLSTTLLLHHMPRPNFLHKLPQFEGMFNLLINPPGRHRVSTRPSTPPLINKSNIPSNWFAWLHHHHHQTKFKQWITSLTSRVFRTTFSPIFLTPIFSRSVPSPIIGLNHHALS